MVRTTSPGDNGNPPLSFTMTRTTQPGANSYLNKPPDPRINVPPSSIYKLRAIERAKNLGGRPTDYREEYCEMVVEWMAEGMSIYEVCRELWVSLDTIYGWAKKNPEFSEALEEGRVQCRAWWEERGRVNLELYSNQKFSTGPWLINMINRFGWTSEKSKVKEDQHRTEHITHTEEKRIVIDVSGISDDKLMDLMRLLTQAKDPEGKQIAAAPIRDTLH